MNNEEIHKLDMKSKDIVEDNISKISELFPDCISEGKIDFDMLKQELSNDIIDDGKEKYQLSWVGKKEALVNANTPCNKTLRPVKEKSVDFDNTKNIYIEGDNLEVLKILQESYLNKIKCIYIDPPYNTGNDFIYTDNFDTETKIELNKSGQLDDYSNRLVSNLDTSGKFHSKWLSNIYARLKLARNLMSEDGLIYISIDDNEAYNLKKICDEIFGENNFINTIVVNMSNMSGPKVQHAINGKRFPKIKEYIIIYSKNKDKYRMNIPKIEKGEWDNEYNIIIPEMEENFLTNIDFKDINILNDEIKCMNCVSLKSFMKENGIDEKNNEWKLNNAYRIFASKPNEALLKKASELTFNQNIIFLKNSSGQNKLIKTDFNKETKTARIELLNAQEKMMTYLGDHWDDIVTTGGVAQEGNVYFGNGKKPTKLLERIITSSNSPEIVLDFYSGSASTAHAVMKYNSKFKKNTKFIMVQIPENLDETLKIANGDSKKNIEETIKFLDRINRPHFITDLAEERIIRSAKKVQEETNADIDYGFRVYKVDSSNMKDVYYAPTDLQQAQLNMFESNIKEDRTSEDLLTQVILDLGLTLDLSIEEREIFNNNVYFVENNSLVACFDDTIDIKIVDEICKCNPLKIVFKESSFKNDSDKINTFERIKKISSETEVNIL